MLLVNGNADIGFGKIGRPVWIIYPRLVEKNKPVKEPQLSGDIYGFLRHGELRKEGIGMASGKENELQTRLFLDCFLEGIEQSNWVKPVSKDTAPQKNNILFANLGKEKAERS